MSFEIFKTIAHLYNRPTSDWIYELEEPPSPIIVNRFLSMNIQNYNICKILNKYIFVLEPKAFLLLAWSMLPKSEKAPFVKYIKDIKEEEDELQFLWDKVCKKNEIYGNDFRTSKDRLYEAFEQNQVAWFKFYGIEKKYWKQFNLDYSKMSEENIENPRVISTPKNALDGWF